MAVFLGFALIVLVAGAFASWPVLRGTTGRARWLLAASLVLFVAGIGAGSYLVVGRPSLALRAMEGTKVRDLNGAIAVTVRHLRTAPNDLRGWRLLGRAYLDANDGDDAIKAFMRAIQVARASGKETPGVYSDYGMALASTTQNGAMPPEAERAFALALSMDPNDKAALYFIGLADAGRGQYAQALALWQRLLGELPASSPFRQELVDRMAALKASSAAAPPDIGQMVAGLAARLKSDPDDPAGWQRLIRAYAVLHDTAKAHQALADARTALVKNPRALSAIAAEAKELGLEK